MTETAAGLLFDARRDELTRSLFRLGEPERGFCYCAELSFILL
jgi:hypothetical protein